LASAFFWQGVEKFMIFFTISALLSTPCEKMASFLIFSPALLRGSERGSGL
jgi:hypothetical protein